MRKSHPKRKAGKVVKSTSQNRISEQPKSIRKSVSIHWSLGKFKSQSLCCCCFSVTKQCLTLCDPVKCSTPCYTVLYLLESAQIHVHSVAIQPSHPLSLPSSFVFNLSQHQGHFQRVRSPHQEAKVLEFQLKLIFSLA